MRALALRRRVSVPRSQAPALPVGPAGAVLGLAATLGLAGCGGGDSARPDDVTWVAERDTLGDTVVVRTVSGSVWGAPARLVEEVSFGVLEGPEEEMFGQILEIAVDGEEGVYVFDGQVPALRYFDAEGDFVRTLGGQGSGPGEYQDAALGLALRSDGRLVMRDPRNGRLNVYDPDGSPLDPIPVASGLFTSRAMVLDTADHVYLKVLLERPEPNRPWKIGLLHLDPSGQVLDTIPPPAFPGEPTTGSGAFNAAKEWDVGRLGQLAVGVSDRYVFEIRYPDGRVVRVERADWEPVPVLPGEKEDWEARNDWIRERRGQFMTSEIPPVPDVKPAYASLRIGEEGRVWVRRHVRAEEVEDVEPVDPDEGPPPLGWREPAVYDVFGPDGSYFGEVEVPPRTSLSVFRGERVWGVRRGELDQQSVVRFRVEVSREGMEMAREGSAG